MARIFTPAERVELDQLRLQLNAIKAEEIKAPTPAAFLTGNSLARFMVIEERKISIKDRIAEIETGRA